jgi:hypothetical protein
MAAPTLSLSPASILIFIGIYMPFESYFLSLSGVGGTTAVIMKLGSELLLYAVFTFAFISRFSDSKLKHSPIDGAVLLLTAVAILATIVYSAPFGSAANNFRALFRYLIVFYLAYHFGFSMKSWNKFSRLFIAVIVLNVFLSIFQFGLGDSFPSFLKVGEKIRVSMTDDAEIQHIEKQEKIGSVQGLQESPGAFGAFLVISVSVLLARLNSAVAVSQTKLRLLLFFSLLAAFLTYSKTGFLLAVLTVIIFFYHYNLRLRRLILVGAFAFMLVGTLTFIGVSSFIQKTSAIKENISATENLLNLFSSEYWNHFFAAERGWVLKEVGSQLLLSLPVIGYSPDPDTARKMIADSSSGQLARLVGYMAFEDVYWVALLGYYGLVGMAMLFVIFFTLYRRAVSVLRYARLNNERNSLAFASAFLALLFTLVPYCFFERVLEINVFSFYFWLMGGITLRLHHDYLGKNNPKMGHKG